MNQTVTINVRALTPQIAQTIAKNLEKIGSNLDSDAIQILANKSAKSGMSDKLRKYKHLI